MPVAKPARSGSASAGVAVTVGVGVAVAVGVGVAVGVAVVVEVAVAVGVAVSVGVAVAVDVAVSVGVAVAVGVTVAVAVGVGSTPLYVTTPAAQFSAELVSSAVYVPVVVTTRNSTSSETWVGLETLPDDDEACARPVYPVPTFLKSFALSSRPKAP